MQLKNIRNLKTMNKINQLRKQFLDLAARMCGKEYGEGYLEALKHVEAEMETSDWQTEKIALAQSLREQARQLTEQACQLEADVRPELMSKHTNSPKGSLHWLRTILGSTMDMLHFVSKYPNHECDVCFHVARLREVLEHYEKN
jgi:hypothetical protein